MGRGWLKDAPNENPLEPPTAATLLLQRRSAPDPPREFAFSRTPVPFIPWLFSSETQQHVAARERGWSPVQHLEVADDGAREGARRREDTQGEACGWAHPRRTCSSEAARPSHEKWRRHSLEMQKYLFWFSSLFLEILFWFIKHRKSQHLKQTFKTPMWPIIDFWAIKSTRRKLGYQIVL